MSFNEEKRSSSALKISIASLFYNILQLILAFVYRSVFVRYFSVNYLGLNGLFSNILTLLSLSELGITTPIIYRLYKPMAEGDTDQVGKLMWFYKSIYQYIFAVIVILGLSICPFIKLLVKDQSQIPDDINIYAIYLLFLFQTASTYLFAYKQSLLIADRKHYITAVFNMVTCSARYFVQIYLVIYLHNYVFILVYGIAVNLLSNILLSAYVTRKYKEIFLRYKPLEKKIKEQIFEDSKKCLMHRIGYKILTSTDNIVIAKTIGIVETGLYSNYTMISGYLASFFAELLGNYAGIIGNIITSDDMEHIYDVFKRLIFLSLWLNTTMTIMLYCFFNIFIRIWLGEDYCFHDFTVALLCLYFFLTNLRLIPNSFIGVSPLFTRDALRPLIQAVINLVVSILLALYIGIDGVIIGSIVCVLLTVFWREPYLLYKYFFKKSGWYYWMQVTRFIISLVMIIILFRFILGRFFINGFLQMLTAMACGIFFIQVFLVMVTFRMSEFRYFKDTIHQFYKQYRIKNNNI